MSELTGILENFCRLDGVEGALVLRDDGSIVGESFESERDSGPLAQIVHRTLKLGACISEGLSKGAVNQQYVEYEGLQITSEVLAHHHVLVIVAGAGANLGRIRLEIRKSKSTVESHLG